jgi:hypothetical protein
MRDSILAGQVMPSNPASAVQVAKTGKTPCWKAANGGSYSAPFRPKPSAILWKRAPIATLTYSFARIGAR